MNLCNHFRPFSGPSWVRRWSLSVSKSVLGLNESGYSQLLIALIDRFICICLYLVKPGFHMISGIASKLFSDHNDHMETKFSFCQRSPKIPATANDRNDHDRWDRIRVYLCDCSDRNNRNDPSHHMETIAHRSQRS